MIPGVMGTVFRDVESATVAVSRRVGADRPGFTQTTRCFLHGAFVKVRLRNFRSYGETRPKPVLFLGHPTNNSSLLFLYVLVRSRIAGNDLRTSTTERRDCAPPLWQRRALCHFQQIRLIIFCSRCRPPIGT